jgi:hypothetical protein
MATERKRRIFNYRNMVAATVGAIVLAPELMGLAGTTIGTGVEMGMAKTSEGRAGIFVGVAMGNNETNVASFPVYAQPYLGKHQPLGLDLGFGWGGYKTVVAMTGGDPNFPTADAYGHRVSTGEGATNLTTVQAPRRGPTTVGNTGP